MYSAQALADARLYRLVKLTGWTEQQLETEISAEFATRLLRADGAFSQAEAEQMRRSAPKSPPRG